MNTESDYSSQNYFPNENEKLKICYLCNKILGDINITLDHIIPATLFSKKDPFKPKLYVHHKCNNKKSFEDRWFVKQLQFRSSTNPEAENELSKLLDSAKSEIKDAYVIGKKVKNLKLARTLFDKIDWSIQVEHQGKELIYARLPESDVLRFENYVKFLCKGLFLRNVFDSNPNNPKIKHFQFVHQELKGTSVNSASVITDLFRSSSNTRFVQRWGERILYFGSRVKESDSNGFIYIQFYNQYGLLAVFDS
jgi:hypothetical protein